VLRRVENFPGGADAYGGRPPVGLEDAPFPVEDRSSPVEDAPSLVALASPGADALRARIGRRLEVGLTASPLGRLAATAWGAWSARAVARPLDWPAGVRLIGVGGAVLGGAGKTPVAIALARALVAPGERPALIGHAYRARPGAPRVVRPDDVVTSVGDDALCAARLLGDEVAVIVATGRRAAIHHAAALGHRTLVADGLLQAAPRRLSASILVLDALAPFGSGACPPLGDLRAPRAALLAAADVVAALLPEGASPHPDLPAGAILVPGRIAGVVSAAGEPLPLAALAGRRLGLLLAVARPERIVSALTRAGVRPAVTLRLADHAGPAALIAAARASAAVDAWLTTARCATKLPVGIAGVPVLALDHRLDVGDLVTWLAKRAWERTGGPC
jgi:tetraacyldisaccharide 4'-kinase